MQLVVAYCCLLLVMFYTGGLVPFSFRRPHARFFADELAAFFIGVTTMSTSCPIPGCNAATMAVYLGDVAYGIQFRRFDAIDADELENLDAYPEAAQHFLLAMSQLDAAYHSLRLAQIKLQTAVQS